MIRDEKRSWYLIDGGRGICNLCGVLGGGLRSEKSTWLNIWLNCIYSVGFTIVLNKKYFGRMLSNAHVYYWAGRVVSYFVNKNRKY